MLIMPRTFKTPRRAGFNAALFAVMLFSAAPSYAGPADLFVAGFQSMATEWTVGLQKIFSTKQAVKDAEVQGEADMLKNEQAAKDQAENTPSEPVGRSVSKTMAMGESSNLSDNNKLSISTLIQNGDMGNAGKQFFAGATDLKNIQAVNGTYADPSSNDGAPLSQCDPGTQNCAAQKTVPGRYDRDLEVARFIQRPTLDINMMDDKSSPDEIDIQAFINNLTPPLSTQTIAWDNAQSAGQNVAMMNFRHVIARRNVTRNTMTNIIGNRSQGSAGSRTFLMAALIDLGMSEEESKKLLAIQGEVLTKDRAGDLAKEIQPSYNAQMLVLTKKTYQAPNFYANLISNPADISRAQATMQAIGLMQRRDMYESLLRRELLLSQLLEMDINDEQAIMEKRALVQLSR